MENKCTKLAFESAQDVRDWAKLIKFNKNKSSRSSNTKHRPYECRRCGKWHATTKTKLQIRRKRKRYEK